jgi:hypothetical protein
MPMKLENLISQPRDIHQWFEKVYRFLTKFKHYSVAVAPSSVSANTTSEQAFTVTGVNTNDIIIVNKPTHQAGLGIVGARASDTDEVSITYMNTTGGGITPTSETYDIVAIRKD